MKLQKTPERIPTYDEWMRSPDFPAFVVERRTRGKNSTSVFLLRQDYAFPDPAAPELVLQVLTAGSLEPSVELGFGRFRQKVRPGGFLVSVPDRPVDIVSEQFQFELLTIALPWPRLRPQIEETINRDLPHFGGSLHSSMHYDPTVWQLSRFLWEELNSPCPSSELCTQGLETALVGRLLFLSNLLTEDRRGDGKLSSYQLRRVVDLMHAQLEVGVELDELAAVAGISRFHFARSFKRTTGVSPNQYLIRLRVNRAEQMLRDPAYRGQPLTHIAAACGFADQAHMTRLFKRQTGITPSRYQRGS